MKWKIGDRYSTRNGMVATIKDVKTAFIIVEINGSVGYCDLQGNAWNREYKVYDLMHRLLDKE